MHRIWGIGLSALLVAQTGAAFADPSVTSKSRSKLFKSQTRILDTRAASQYANSVRLQPSYDIPGRSNTDLPSYRGPYKGPYLAMAKSAARRHNVPEALFLRLVQQESGWNPKATSPKGARGLSQLMPGTARILRVDPDDPRENLEGGARYLRQQFEKFRSWRLALAAYNAGPGSVEKYGGVPPFPETESYVKAILGG